MSNFKDIIRTISTLSKDSQTNETAKRYLTDIVTQRHINYVSEDYFVNKYSAPYKVADLKFASCPSWNTFAIESSDLLYSDKFYKYDDAGLLEDDYFFYYHISWREGPYEIEKVRINEGDIVVDCGANMGMFSMLAVKQGASKVYAYEPVQSMISLMNDNFVLNDMTDKIVIRPYGLYSESKKMKFSEGKDIGSTFISDSGDTELECVSLDSDISEKIDFIKADIEGAERDMLAGATDVLKKYAPKLSLCTYHKPDDRKVMTRIIKRANPNYKFKFSPWKLYAWVE